MWSDLQVRESSQSPPRVQLAQEGIKRGVDHPPVQVGLAVDSEKIPGLEDLTTWFAFKGMMYNDQASLDYHLLFSPCHAHKCGSCSKYFTSEADLIAHAAEDGVLRRRGR
jgi:hypothetical protein